MILFSEIFSRAVNLFDDPDIRQNYINNPAGFEMQMRPFLINGLNKFQYPTVITEKLTKYSDAQGKVETRNGDGSKTYTLSSTPEKGAAFSFKIGDEFVQAEYSSEGNKVTFPREIKAEETFSVMWYYAGAFTEDFTGLFGRGIPDDAVMEKVKNILAHGVLSSWSDVEMNRAIEMRNIFSDSDLKFYSPANSAREKTNWHKQINCDMDTLVNDLNWMIGSRPKGGSRFGK